MFFQKLINTIKKCLGIDQSKNSTPTSNETRFLKPFREVSKVYLHCSASNNPSHDNISVIRNWHVVGNGWVDVGYHYFIKTDGTIELGRNLEQIPAAQAGHNKGSIAICLHGLNIEDFTENQFKSLKELCKEISEAYEGKVTFHGHNEVSAKACPVFDYKEVLSLDDEGYLTYDD